MNYARYINYYFIISDILFSLLLKKYAMIPAKAKVIAYVTIITVQFPTTRLLPAIVEEIIDGNLAKVDISKNFTGFIGKSPAKYTNKSFGVPGMKNNINNIVYIFLGFENIFEFSSFSIFSFDTKLYKNPLPNFLTAKKITQLLINAPIKITHIPPIAP